MELLRAAYLLEVEVAELRNLPAWKRRDLDNIVRASIRAMREAAERIEQLESLARPPLGGAAMEDELPRPLVARGR